MNITSTAYSFLEHKKQPGRGRSRIKLHWPWVTPEGISFFLSLLLSMRIGILDIFEHLGLDTGN